MNTDTMSVMVEGNRSNSSSGCSPFPDYPKESPALILLFCGYVITWYLQLGSRIEILGKIRFEFWYAVFLIVSTFLFAKKVDLKSPLLPYVIAYFLTLIIQIPFSQDFQISWNVFFNRVVKFSFMATFIIVFVKRPRDLALFLGAFLLACMKMGQEGFIGTITGSMMWENQGIMRLHGPTGLYAHPNSFAGMALGTIPFVWYLWGLGNKYTKLCLAGLAILSFNIILHTGSRTGYIGFLAFIIFAIVESPHKKKILLGALLATILLLPHIPHQYIERFKSTYTLKEKEGHSAEKRIQILKDAWHIFLQHPFGIGVAAFPAVRMKTFGRFQDTHNLYLEVATNLGIQGFVIFFLFVYKMLKMLKQLSRSFSDQIEKLLAFKSNASIETSGLISEHLDDLRLMEATCKAVWLFMMIRLVLGIFGMDLYEIYWWFALGVTISISNMHRIALHKTLAFLGEKVTEGRMF